MSSFEEVANFAIPAILLLVALGFMWVKFIEPFGLPMLKKFWEYAKGDSSNNQTKIKEITYD